MRKAKKFTVLFLVLTMLFNTLLVNAAPAQPTAADKSEFALSSGITVTENRVKINDYVTGFTFVFNGYSENALKTLETITADDFTMEPSYAEVTDVSVEGNVLTLKVSPFKSADGYAVRYNGDLLISMNFTNEDVDNVNEVQPALGPTIVYDPESPTGYTGQFAYFDDEAEHVYFCGDLMLSDWSNPDDKTSDERDDRVDATVYSPFEYRPGMMRRGGTVALPRPGVNYRVEMEKDPETNIWYTEVPLAAGANQYWFNVDDNTRMLPDPANHPKWSPGSNENTKNAYNAVYVPYDEKQDNKILEQRAKYENPRTDEKVGTWSYVPVTISGTQRYLGVYLPYGYDADRAEPYKTIYMLHGAGQDESDWMGIGSIPNIMDNLLANGEAEPAIVVTMNSAALGNARDNFAGLFEGIIPFMEENYNVSDSAKDRSFGGLSMGSSITASIINYNALGFGYYCLFSLAGGDAIVNAENVEEACYYFADGGYEQPLSRNPGKLADTDVKYVTSEFAGTHDFNTWNQAFTDYVKNYLWRSENYVRSVERPKVSYTVQQLDDPLHKGPNIIQDPDSPTGYTVKFFYEDVTGSAEMVYFNGDLSLRDGNDLTSTQNYAPEEFQPGFVRVGNSAYQREMRKITDPDEFGAEFVGLWYHEMPLAGGANQYWFYHDSPSGGSTGIGTTKWYPDPNNMPIWNPATVTVQEHITGIKRAYNSIYVPYDEKQASPILEQRANFENPRTDGQTGTLKFERVPNAFTTYDTPVYVSVYTPYGYNPNRKEPYKTVYITPATDQNESDWFGIGSAQNIMDNLVAQGLAEPMVIVSVSMRAEVIGGKNDGFNNLFKYVIPYIENKYNVSTEPTDRAVGGHYTTSTDLLHSGFAEEFGYFSMFSNSTGNLISDSPNVELPRYYFCNGYTENPLAMDLLDETNAMYVYDRPTGGHNFNAWNQGLVSYLQKVFRPEQFARKEGPSIIKDPSSPTGYTGRFVYKDEDAEQVYFCGDLMLSNHANPDDTTIYSPFDYKPGMMRRGGAQFKEPMVKGEDGLWYYELPLTAGANQYWFNVDDGTRMLPDPANHPQWSPGSNWDTKNAYNAVYVPYDEKQDYAPLAARVVENPRTDGKVGTWSYESFELNGTEQYVGVYLPYGYDADRAEPYKTIYMQHGGGQDESDWMGIGSVQNIMDNLLADGLTEPAVIVTTDSKDLGNAAQGYPNLFNVILPFIEDNYNVSTKVADRSFAGLSMGGMITTNIINYDITKFKYYGVFSGGAGSAVANAKNLGSAYILFGNGQYERLMDMSALEGTDANYDYLQFAGAHDFNTWCQLFTTYVRDYLWKPEAFEIKAGPRVVKDPDSPTGYTGQFVYFDDEAEQVYFCGDLMLSNHADPSDTKVYTPFEYKPGLMRRGGAQFKEPMKNLGNGYWYYELPLAAGANQYWFNVDDGNRMLPDPENHPQWSPGSNWNTKNAYNAIYVPYDEKQAYAPLAAREIENPRTDEQVGTWSYVPVTISGTTRYMGVYLPYGYDADRAEPYKLIYMLHGAGQDESDWMGIGSVQNILDNLIANGETEPAVLVSLGSAYFGSNFENLFNVIMPFVEDNYNVSGEAKDQSFAGLSMGAMNTSSIIRQDSSKFRYYGLFSGARIANIIQGSNLDKTYMLIGDGLYEGGQSEANLNSLANSGANYDYLRVAGAHDFNTWCQLFTTYVRDYLWKPSSFTDISTGALNYLINKAEALKADGALKDAKPAVVTEFNAALQAAKDVRDDTSATQADIYAASQRLLDAIGMVDWKIANKGDLAQAIELAGYITDNLDAYVDAGKAELADALSAANTVYADENALQDEVDDAFLDLMDAVTNMRLKADKDRLEELINRAQTYNLSLYTADSVEVFRAVLAKVDTIMIDDTLSIEDQKVIDQAADELETAMNGLVRLSDNSDKTTDDTPKDDTPKDDTSKDDTSKDTDKDSGNDATNTGDQTESTVALIAILFASALLCELMRRKAGRKHTVK